LSDKFKSINCLDKYLVKDCFVEIFFNCFFLNSTFFLFKNINCKNSEYLSNFLIYSEKNFYENWFFHYFIPLNSFDNNYLLICYKKDLNIDLTKLLNPEIVYTDFNQIINIWCNDICWELEDLNNHSFNWRDQQIVSEYLDLVCGGVVDFLPVHWTKPYNLKNLENHLIEKILWYYNIYLHNNKLEDTIDNKIYFISNFNYEFLPKYD
jgi:hypothetical protein